MQDIQLFKKPLQDRLVLELLLGGAEVRGRDPQTILDLFVECGIIDTSQSLFLSNAELLLNAPASISPEDYRDSLYFPLCQEYLRSDEYLESLEKLNQLRIYVCSEYILSGETPPWHVDGRKQHAND